MDGSDWPLSVEVRLLLSVPSGSIDRTLSTHSFDPSSWVQAVAEHQRMRADLGWRDLCLLCGEPAGPRGTTSPEHVVLDGLGIGWAKLPQGATCDICNNGSSGAELRFQREGLLSLLRPFYLRRQNSIRFEDAANRSLVLRNDPARGFLIELHGLTMPETSEGGPGTLTLIVPAKRTHAESASRALHKIAYLMLATVQPRIALARSFDDVRNYLARRTPDVFRPFDERFIPAAAPGFSVRFALTGKVAEDENRVAIDTVQAAVRLHHCVYFLSLLGPFEPPVDDARQYRSVRDGGDVQPLSIKFRFDSIREI